VRQASSRAYIIITTVSLVIAATATIYALAIQHV